MVVIAERRRTQPPPPHIVYEALIDPHRDPHRVWLMLRVDEQEPQVLECRAPDLVVWSSLWPSRPSATIRFEIESDGGSGCALRWTLADEEPAPDASVVGHMRKRINELINANLRYTFGQ